MSIYYIRTIDNIVFELSSTTDITTTDSGKATDFPIQTGESVADHYVQDPLIIKFKGIITDVRSLSNLGNAGWKGPQDYIVGLKQLKASKVPFSVGYSDILSPAENCVFNSFELTQNSKHGVISTSNISFNSFEISLTMKQLRFGEAALVEARPASDFENLAAEKAVGSGSTSTPTSPEETTIRERATAAKVINTQELDSLGVSVGGT